MRLDRLLSNQNGISRQTARDLLHQGRVRVDDQICRDGLKAISSFMQVTLDHDCLQVAKPGYYLMLHKPAGYLSATQDPQHPTVLELMPAELREHLHLAGRLDRSTTGLLLLTNDGLWSRRLTAPGSDLAKVYRVTTSEPISPEAAARFADGIFLARENLYTRPAALQLLGPCQALLSIYEGRHHQVKRMFHAVGNRVCALHRERMGPLQLDPALAPGDFRPLSSREIHAVQDPT
ncbi:pseudouridine synthase [Halopseudomonas salegens]|uniref:Pseudouridine synthase n=1 Tax=Halopseudomonas salegens TaxID=1434072 RepID=A0A1H2I358_9GAMM|nr:pseudouridine synthase [Halopseudomonas salegens]SDU38580.1 ribosomal small subunit pseudouridine synthase A [Halopseudomonas salegens]